MSNRLSIFAITSIVLICVSACGATGATQPAPHNREDIPAVSQGASIYREGTTEYPELFDQALQSLKQGDLAGAEATYRKIVELEPDNPLGYVGIGLCRLQAQDIPAAEQNYRKAIELDSQSTMAFVGMGSVAYGREQYDETVDWYQKALDIKPDLPDGHYGIAIAYDALGQTQQAKQHFEEFLRLAPSSNLATYALRRLAELESQTP